MKITAFACFAARAGFSFEGLQVGRLHCTRQANGGELFFDLGRESLGGLITLLLGDWGSGRGYLVYGQRVSELTWKN